MHWVMAGNVLKPALQRSFLKRGTVIVVHLHDILKGHFQLIVNIENNRKKIDKNIAHGTAWLCWEHSYDWRQQ